MDLSTYVTQLREDLASAAAAGDEQTQRTGALLGAAIEPAARLALMNALADLAAEVTEALGDRVVEVRLDGRDVRVAVSAPDDNADEPEPESAQSPFAGFGRRGFAGFGGWAARRATSPASRSGWSSRSRTRPSRPRPTRACRSTPGWRRPCRARSRATSTASPAAATGGMVEDGRDGKRVKGWVQG